MKNFVFEILKIVLVVGITIQVANFIVAKMPQAPTASGAAVEPPRGATP